VCWANNNKNDLLFTLLISLIGIKADKFDMKEIGISGTLDELILVCGT